MSSCTCPTGHPCDEYRRLRRVASVAWRKVLNARDVFTYSADPAASARTHYAAQRAHRLAVQALHEHREHAESGTTHTEDREG